MKKLYYIATSIILMLMLLPTLATTIPTVEAYDYGYGYASNLYTTNWLQHENATVNHAEEVWTAFINIADLFYDAGYTYWWFEPYQMWIPIGPAYGEVQNWGSSETPDDVYYQIDHDNAYHSDFSTVLYVGHGGPLGFYGHTDYPDDPEPLPDLISYDIIQSHTQSSPAHQFAFNWVCFGGNDSPNGAPRAWNPLWWSNPGSYPPYTWIGFDNFSPWLYEGMGTTGAYGQENIYRYWLVFFYYFALTGYYTVAEACDQASQATGFDNYGSSILATGYTSYWPYTMTIQGMELTAGPYEGEMHVAGHPLGTYLPTDFYIW